MEVNNLKNPEEQDFRLAGDQSYRNVFVQEVGGSARNRARYGFATANAPKACDFC
jgi:hypothetical protein